MCLIPKDKIFSLTRALENSVSQLVKPFLICDHQFSILWFEIDVPYLWASSDIRKNAMNTCNYSFSVPPSVWRYCGQNRIFFTVSVRKHAETIGLLLVLETFNHKILREKPSTQPCIGQPYGFSLSYPSTCQPKFGPTDTYCLRLRRCAFRFLLPFGSSSLSNFMATSRFIFTRYDTINKLQRVL